MSLDNTKLLDFLGEVDKELTRRIVVVAVGGTAMTLVDAKPSTIDVDFTIPGEDMTSLSVQRRSSSQVFGWMFFVTVQCL
ncbi:MAG: hypothetical protein J4F36_13680 [Nitrosopumilaceae archaeon]|nr:hypothetical protein [Nitrosopumilaceae archaeon]